MRQLLCAIAIVAAGGAAAQTHHVAFPSLPLRYTPVATGQEDLCLTHAAQTCSRVYDKCPGSNKSACDRAYQVCYAKAVHSCE
jgi:hypothetical protein